MNIRKPVISIATIAFGAFLVVYGGYDDSPGGQLIGLVAVILGVIGAITSIRRMKNIQNNQKGLAPVVVIFIVVVLGAGVYAVVNRAVLKSYFETGDKPSSDQRTALEKGFEDGDVPTGEEAMAGDKPTAAQFSNVIDSSVNLADAQKKQENPTNAAPGNNKTFTPAEAEKGIAFRWTALVPKPKEPVTYRLRVWQLMEGQNGTQAMRTNKPVFTKDVSETGATASNLYTGPCKPPYLCDFVWSVDAIGSAGSLSGSSEPFSFRVVEAAAEVNAGTDSSAGSR